LKSAYNWGVTRRQDELQLSSYERLMHAAGEHMSEDALKALREYQEIRDAGGTPQVYRSPHHGWVIKDLSKGD
jgi:hypothetical protein